MSLAQSRKEKAKVRREKNQGCTKENKADAKARAGASVLFSSMLDHTKFKKGGTETIVPPICATDTLGEGIMRTSLRPAATQSPQRRSACVRQSAARRLQLREGKAMDTTARCASRKAAWRLIPFLILCFFIAFLDRVNVGFAALTMNKELGLTAEIYSRCHPT